MALFKFKIYDLHEKPSIIEGEFWFLPEEIVWKVFDLYIDTDYIQVVSFRSYALFAGDGDVKECTKVLLSDGSSVFATKKVDAFETNYSKNCLGILKDVKPEIKETESLG